MIITDEDLLKRLSQLNASIVHDALRAEGLENQTLSHDIKPILAQRTMYGKVWTLSGELHKNINVHESLLSWTHFLSKVKPETVVICQPNNQSIALMGELSAETLLKKNIKGYVVDGGCRDVKRIKDIGLQVYCKFFSPKDVAGKWKVTEMGKEITISEVVIKTGDYVIGDEDGVVIIPKDVAKKIIMKAEKDLNSENKIRDAIMNDEDPQQAYLRYRKF
ncbi:MAG: 4-hydroxy-4-methyl-2-oxoglutarate aldolase/4-carboxy-4-hydroxy-2-oxoadipate aldolase [Alphaproteobacteria bacterium MarineAlpha9_Bin1]|nr:MAG: 4-hydroxy-4-methyl-2-oxoglutarate aldolase/4-carboxy-4-hydroxy-2-oxoadipate aldolase [Alphaproteobacteria bacterium MarineAlpha9_Bin1]